MALRVIEVYVRETDHLNTVVRYKVEKLQSGHWHEREHIDLNAGTDGAKRKFLLENDERLIVEDISVVSVVWDKEQMAAKPIVQGLSLSPPPEETEYSSQMEK